MYVQYTTLPLPCSPVCIYTLRNGRPIPCMLSQTTQNAYATTSAKVEPPSTASSLYTSTQRGRGIGPTLAFLPDRKRDSLRPMYASRRAGLPTVTDHVWRP